MKAVIVECSNSAAVALCDDGSFKRIPNQNYSIGQELFLKPKASRNRTIKRLSICASLALFLSAFAGIGSYSYVNPYSYVSLDINPAIEYALNRYDKVIRVSGINDDGKQVVSSIESDVKNQNITAALSTTIEQLEKDNYISSDTDNHVIISVCSANDTKAESIASKVNTLSETESDLCSIDTVTVSQEIKEDADSLGITPGKLALIHAVAETSPDENFDVNDWTDKTVVELEATIQEATAKQSSSPKGKPAKPEETTIDSEFLDSMLDESTMSSISGSATATASAEETTKKNSSTSTDDKKANPTSPDGVSEKKPSEKKADEGSASGKSSDASTGNDTSASGTTVKPAEDSEKTTASEPKTSDLKTDSETSGETGTDTGNTSSESAGTNDTPESSVKKPSNDSDENTSSKKDSSDETSSSKKDSSSEGSSSSKKDSSDESSSSKKHTSEEPQSSESASKKNPLPAEAETEPEIQGSDLKEAEYAVPGFDETTDATTEPVVEDTTEISIDID